MILPVLLACLGGFLPDSTDSDGRLRAVRWSKESDTLRVEFEFEGARPRRMKLASLEESGGGPGLRLDLEGIRWRKSPLDLPSWFHGSPTSDSTGSVFRIDLRRSSVWRATWKEDILGLEMVGRARPAWWADARVLGTLGVGMVVAGAATVWMSHQEEPGPVPADPVDDGIIPPPDFGFPR